MTQTTTSTPLQQWLQGHSNHLLLRVIDESVPDVLNPITLDLQPNGDMFIKHNQSEICHGWLAAVPTVCPSIKLVPYSWWSCSTCICQHTFLPPRFPGRREVAQHAYDNMYFHHHVCQDTSKIGALFAVKSLNMLTPTCFLLSCLPG